MFKEYEETYRQFNSKFLGFFEENSSFSKILNYSINEGKRIRPILLLETYKMLKGEDYNETVLNFSIGLELIHNYSLVHDDLPAMDDDDYRRGRLTVHKKFGEDMAILAGDALLNKAYEIIFDQICNSTTHDEFIARSKAGLELSKYAGDNGMIKGQVLDVLDISSNIDEVLDMYEKKTGGLIIAATVCAAHLSNSAESVVEDMRELGYCIGLCFQLQDDLLDKESDESSNRVTYLTLTDEVKTKNKIDELTNKSIEILEKYKDNRFLVDLVKKLVKREY